MDSLSTLDGSKAYANMYFTNYTIFSYITLYLQNFTEDIRSIYSCNVFHKMAYYCAICCQCVANVLPNR